jgi:single stranded DNA-binding protein (ssb)
MALNRVLLIGNVGKEPEVRHLEGGASVANFTLATTERFRDRNNGETKETTEWHNIVAWRQLADLSEKFIHKGSQIFVEGSIRTRSYQDNNGQTRYVTEIVASGIQLLGRKGDNQAAPAEGSQASHQSSSYSSGPSYQSPRPASAAPQPSPAPEPQPAPAPAQEEPIDLNVDQSQDDLPF